MSERVRLRRKPAAAKAGGKANGHSKLTLDEWADAINTEWGKSVEAIVNTGKLLKAAKKAVGHGRWLNLIGHKLQEGRLAFARKPGSGQEIARQLMRIAENKVIANSNNFWNLPQSRSTLYALTGYREDYLQLMIDSGEVHAGLKLREVKNLYPDRWCHAEAHAQMLRRQIDFAANRKLTGEQLADFRYWVGQRVPHPWYENMRGYIDWLSEHCDRMHKIDEARRIRQLEGDGFLEDEKGRRSLLEPRVIADPMADAMTKAKANGKAPPRNAKSGNGAAV